MTETLRAISADLIASIQGLSKGRFDELFSMKDYHGFIKSRFPDEMLRATLKPYGYTPETIQIGLVQVDTDLSNEIHFHKKAHAYTVVLGEGEHVEGPRDGLIYKDGVWSDAVPHQEIDIPPGTPHTFSVKPGGTLTFLSVQTPPIEDTAGHDDYYHPEAFDYMQGELSTK